MRIALLTVGISTVVAGSAAAQPPTELVAPERSTQWWVEAGAALGSSAASGARAEALVDATLTQEGGYGYGILLPQIESTGELRLGAGGDAAGLSLSHGTRARALAISAPDTRDSVLPTDVRYQLDRHVRPELSSPLGLLRRTYSRAGAGWTLAFAELYGWRLLGMGFDVARVQQDAGDRVARHTQYDFELTFFTWTRYRDDHRPELAIDIIAARGPAIDVDDGPDASVGRVDLLAGRNLPLLAGLYADAAVGVAGTGTFSASVTDSNGDVDWETTVMTEDLPLMSVPTASARLHGDLGAVELSLSAGRTLDLTSQVDLALDDRATGALRWTGLRDQLLLQGFAARTTLWTDTETSEVSLTGGGLVSWRRALGHKLAMTATVELARSFYAAVDDDPTPRPETAMRGSLLVARSFGTR